MLTLGTVVGESDAAIRRTREGVHDSSTSLTFPNLSDSRSPRALSRLISSASIAHRPLPLIHVYRIQMIVENLPNKGQNEDQLDSSELNNTAALEELPPSFEQATEDRLLPDPPQQDPPPAFSTYTASFFTAGNGAIISHDPHLNEDGMYLATPSSIYLHYLNAAQSR